MLIILNNSREMPVFYRCVYCFFSLIEFVAIYVEFIEFYKSLHHHIDSELSDCKVPRINMYKY